MGDKIHRHREYRGPMPPCVMIRARSPSKYEPERLILENRRKEEIMDGMIRAVAAQKRSDLHTDWLTHADHKAWVGDVWAEVDRHLHVHSAGVDQRRERLRQLLSQEEKDYELAMVEAEETPLERKARMRARVKNLRDRKEKERLELVQEKYDQQFREQCDDLRSTLSRREQDFVCAERMMQVKEKEEQAKEKKAQDAMFADLWEKDRLEKVAREEREAQEVHEKKREALENLEKQMAALGSQKEEAKKLKEEEQQLMKEQEALRKLEEQATQEEKRRQQQQTKDQLDESLRAKMLKKAREEQEQLAFELKMLEQMLEESRNEAKERAQRKLELREEEQRYQDYLAQMLEEDKRREKELDELCQKQCDADYQKQIDKWKAHRNMQQQLLQDVIAGRKKQIEERLAENERRKAENAKEQEALRDLEEERQYELQQAMKRKAENLQYQSDLMDQIEENRRSEEERRRFLDYEYLMGQQAEMEYQNKVHKLLANPDFKRLHPLRRAHLAQTQKVKEM